MRELSDETLERYAREFARSYCRRWRNFAQLDDLTQEIACFLLEQRELWDEPLPLIRCSVNRYLMQLYRQNSGARRKYGKTTIALGESSETLQDGANELEHLERRDVLETLAARAMRETRSERHAALVELYLKGYTAQEIAAAVGCTKHAAIDRLKPFKRRLKELIKGVKNEY